FLPPVRRHELGPAQPEEETAQHSTRSRVSSQMNREPPMGPGHAKTINPVAAVRTPEARLLGAA
ncbi:unnamed protein product, partial [Lampetra fluviatilis]